MNRATYLKIVGRIELFITVLFLIADFVLLIAASVQTRFAMQFFGLADSYGILVKDFGARLLFLWVVFLVCCFLAPALGVLFLAVADLLEGSSRSSRSGFSSSVNTQRAPTSTVAETRSEEKEPVAEKQEATSEEVTTPIDESQLIQTGKTYIEPRPREGSTVYAYNHYRGEKVLLEEEIDGIPVGTEGIVLGVLENYLVDVQFTIDGETVVKTLKNYSIKSIA